MSDRPSEERTIYIALVLVGLLPVVGALARGGALGVGFTLCALMIVAGTIGLLSDAWHARKRALPQARTVDHHARSGEAGPCDRSSTPQTR
jgi:hypothetical protein